MNSRTKIWVFSGKISLANADAIIMTVDPYRMLFGNIEREIRKEEGGRGDVYYIQLPKERIENTKTFISYGNYQMEVYDTSENIAKCSCPNCRNYKICLANKKGGLHCAVDIGRYNCISADYSCICENCIVHRKNYLNSEYYCVRGSMEENKGKKRHDIIFVSDFYASPLRDIMISGLEAADAAGYKSVAFPPLRMQPMWREVEPSKEAKIGEIAAGLARYIETHPESKIDTIKFMIDNDPGTYSSLVIEMEKYKSLEKRLMNKRRGIFGI